MAASVASVSGGREFARTSATVGEKAECVQRFLHCPMGSPNHYELEKPSCRNRLKKVGRPVLTPKTATYMTRLHGFAYRWKEITNTCIRLGYRRVHVMPKREEWQLERSQAYRLCREEQLLNAIPVRNTA